MTQEEKEYSTDRAADPVDVASDQEMAFTETAIREARSKVRQDQTPDSDGNYEVEDCEECGLEIGYQRLRLAPRNLLCVFCASAEEKKRKRMG